MTYHPESDVVVTEGFLTPFLSSPSLLHSSPISEHKSALDAYFEDIALNTTLSDVMELKWRDFVTRPKLLMSWIDGSCDTSSKREEFMKKLATYIHLESYGSCGTYNCTLEVDRWWEFYSHQYLFALIMEDYLCDHYVSSELYKALLHGLVPVVWGGADYKHILPPGSYIDARMYHPRALGDLLTALQRDPVTYGKYHVWRRHWTVKEGGSLCDLCDHLFKSTTRGHHINISEWRQKTQYCVGAPSGMFEDDNWKEVIYQ
ncbi:alpha-(1,3)-fucosyltransferase C-like [Penaeus chinensis]|uniref:alpha-(1,3)-fucosyltransferase C-like n=1 Tax=Penaeus chinensis TaxID=139456 RepID=UPI001FB66754|nr:alpha-(1,3)-fucosyltransferase C-like [Penaeus chinensis]XP_047473046.1 alpha-(1,3)-fucosyltransferase C-like [Penaeus chinensis]